MALCPSRERSPALAVSDANLHRGHFEWLNRRVNPDAVLDLKTALVAAAREPNARGRAISALRGSDVWAAISSNSPTLLRTLTNSQQLTALPLFSDERELHEAALRYGWLTGDGQAARRLMPLWEAMRAAKQQGAQLMVIDISSKHALELDEGDMELLSAAPSSRPAAHNQPKLRSTQPLADESVEVKRASARPMERSTGGSGHYSSLRPSSVTPSPGTHAVSATFGATPTATMVALQEEPRDDLLDELSEVLRAYPEVEWACLVSSARADSHEHASVALRIEPAFRKNLAEIGQRLREVSNHHGQRYDVLVLDTAEQMKQARNIGMPFYPWRK